MVLNTPMVLRFQRMVSPTVLNPPTVLMISPICIMISPTVLSIPRVLKITSHGTHDIPHSTEHPHGTQDIPTFIMISPMVLNTPWYSRFPHGTQDIPHGTHDIPHDTEHPPRYCTHIIQGDVFTPKNTNQNQI